MGIIYDLGLSDLALAPKGIYTSSNTKNDEYNIPVYSTIYKYSDSYFNGSFLIKRGESENSGTMYSFNAYLKKFTKLVDEVDYTPGFGIDWNNPTEKTVTSSTLWSSVPFNAYMSVTMQCSSSLSPNLSIDGVKVKTGNSDKSKATYNQFVKKGQKITTRGTSSGDTTNVFTYTGTLYPII